LKKTDNTWFTQQNAYWTSSNCQQFYLQRVWGVPLVKSSNVKSHPKLICLYRDVRKNRFLAVTNKLVFGKDHPHLDPALPLPLNAIPPAQCQFFVDSSLSFPSFLRNIVTIHLFSVVVSPSSRIRLCIFTTIVLSNCCYFPRNRFPLRSGPPPLSRRHPAPLSAWHWCVNSQDSDTPVEWPK
jgi:hypothetical protein